jgi:hypothetical protein
VLQETVIDLVASKSFTIEQRRAAWTNYNNLKMWFRNWELDLVKLGFAHVQENTGESIIPADQMRRILNFDESCLSLDGSTQTRSGRPEVVFWDPRFPLTGRSTSKC